MRFQVFYDFGCIAAGVLRSLDVLCICGLLCSPRSVFARSVCYLPAANIPGTVGEPDEEHNPNPPAKAGSKKLDDPENNGH